MPLASRWPWQARAKSGLLALSSDENSVRYVHADEATDAGATLSAWGVVRRGSDTRESFMKRVKAALPPAAQAIMVLEPGDYQIIPLEAPNVPPDELIGAVRWRATEFLEGSPEDYTLDVLNVASGGAGTGKVIAVAAHNDVVLARMRDAEALGLPLSIIDVPEMAQRNLLVAALAAEASPPRVAALLVAGAGWASLVIVVKGELYFFRRFEFNVDSLAVPVDQAQPAMMGEGEVADAAARSLAQIQRSLFPWEDAYAHLPLESLRVHAGPKTAAIVDRIGVEAGIDTRALPLARLFRSAGSKTAPPWDDPPYLPLLGALLRPRENP